MSNIPTCGGALTMTVTFACDDAMVELSPPLLLPCTVTASWKVYVNPCDSTPSRRDNGKEISLEGFVNTEEAAKVRDGGVAARVVMSVDDSVDVKSVSPIETICQVAVTPLADRPVTTDDDD